MILTSIGLILLQQQLREVWLINNLGLVYINNYFLVLILGFCFYTKTYFDQIVITS
jgi:hypothetical protein